MSRLILRLTIAWLHFIQPLARAAGQVRGALADVDHGEEVVETLPRGLTLTDVARALPLVLGRSVERQYWSEQWTEPGVWLTEILNHLRCARVGRGIEVDDGWQPKRDVSVKIGRWGWLDLRGLIEDHGSGKRLGRLGIRMRLAGFGWLVSSLIVVTLVVGAALAPVTLAPAIAGIVAAAAVAGRWAWLAARVSGATERAIELGSAACGFRLVD